MLFSKTKLIKYLINDLNTSFGDKISAKIANNCDYQTLINYKLPNYNDDINIDEYVNSSFFTVDYIKQRSIF